MTAKLCLRTVLCRTSGGPLAVDPLVVSLLKLPRRRCWCKCISLDGANRRLSSASRLPVAVLVAGILPSRALQDEKGRSDNVGE